MGSVLPFQILHESKQNIAPDFLPISRWYIFDMTGHASRFGKKLCNFIFIYFRLLFFFYVHHAGGSWYLIGKRRVVEILFWFVWCMAWIWNGTGSIYFFLSGNVTDIIYARWSMKNDSSTKAIFETVLCILFATDLYLISIHKWLI